MRRPLSVALFSLVMMLVSAGAAKAYFRSSGAGTGSASVGTLQGVTVAAYAGEATNSQLIPGGSADVIMKVSNLNNFAVIVTTVSAGTGSIRPDIGHLPGCSPTGVTFNAPGAVSLSAPANSTTVFHLTGAASMDATSATGCQGATFSIPVKITVAS